MGLKRLASLMEAEHVASWTRCARQVAALVGAAGPDMTCWQEPIHHHANKPYRFAAAKMHAQVGMNAPDIAGDNLADDGNSHANSSCSKLLERSSCPSGAEKMDISRWRRPATNDTLNFKFDEKWECKSWSLGKSCAKLQPRPP